MFEVLTIGFEAFLFFSANAWASIVDFLEGPLNLRTFVSPLDVSFKIIRGKLSFAFI